MKIRIIALGLFTLITAGVSLTGTSTGSAESFGIGPSAAGRETILAAPVEKGRSPVYAGGCTGSPSLETANTPSGLPRTSSAYGITDLIGADRVSMPLTHHVPAVSPPAIPPPAAAAQSCAPTRYCLFAGCYDQLLNNTGFDDPSSCNPNWIFPSGYVTPSSSICNTNPFVPTVSKVAVLPYASGFNQSFSVPFENGTLGVGLIFATVGSPTINDKILVELMEGSIVRKTIIIRTHLGPFNCHREDRPIAGDYNGMNLKLRVRSQIVTPGVEFHIDSVFLFYNLM